MSPESRNPDSRGFHLLLVDDDSACRESLHEYFLRAGFQVSCAASGIEAYQSITTSRVDFSVMDVHMPGMTGFEVLQRLAREQLVAAVPPTVLMSSDGEAERLVQALGLPVGFVPKPIRLDSLRRTVLDLLRAQSIELPPNLFGGPGPSTRS